MSAFVWTGWVGSCASNHASTAVPCLEGPRIADRCGYQLPTHPHQVEDIAWSPYVFFGVGKVSYIPVGRTHLGGYGWHLWRAVSCRSRLTRPAYPRGLRVSDCSDSPRSSNALPLSYPPSSQCTRGAWLMKFAARLLHSLHSIRWPMRKSREYRNNQKMRQSDGRSLTGITAISI